MNKNQQQKLEQLKQQIAQLLKKVAESAKIQAQYEQEIDNILTQIENALKGE